MNYAHEASLHEIVGELREKFTGLRETVLSYVIDYPSREILAAFTEERSSLLRRPSGCLVQEPS
jgi:hypothetical protein